MPYCTPPMVNSWSKKGEFPNTSPERDDRPITKRIGDVLAALPNCPSGAYQRPSRSSRWKFPEPPSAPPDCDSPIECMVPAVGNGRWVRGSRSSETPREGRGHVVEQRAA